MRHLFALIILCITILLPGNSLSIRAQPFSHTLHGIVTDSITGEPIGFANIAAVYGNRAVLSDDSGAFSIKMPSGTRLLRISALGYNKKEINVADTDTVLNILLAPPSTTLQEVTVKAKKEKYSKKNNPAVELMEKIRASKDKYDPARHDNYSYDKYEKIVLALNDFSLKEGKRGLPKKFRFLYEHLDTSEVSGKPILPLSVKEKSSKVISRNNPNVTKEIVDGYKQNGIDEVADQESIRKFLEDVFREIDIYSNDITLMQNRFVSPLSAIGSNYYKYYLDTIKIMGKPMLELSFAPHNPESFGFNGRMFLTPGDSTYFISKVVMQVPKAINLNYVKSMYIVQNFEQGTDGTRYKTSDDMTVEFEIIPGTQGFYARRQTGAKNFSHDAPGPEYKQFMAKEGKDFWLKEAYLRPESYWDEHRQMVVGSNEKSMGTIMQRLRAVPVFYWTEKVLSALISGYIKTGKESKFDFGPVNTLVSANTVEGARFRLGGMTTANLSKHWFSRGYVAYGTKDRKFKYGAELEYSFVPKEYHSREFPINSIKLEHQYDLDHLGQHYLFTNSDNVFLSLKRQPDDKVTYRRITRLDYKLEKRNGFSFEVGLKHEIQEATRWLPFENGYGDLSKRYTQAAFTLMLRYAPGETFYQGKTVRLPINMDAPVIMFTHEYGPKGFLGSAFTTNKTELSVQKRFWFSAFGYADVLVKAGKIWSQVQYPALAWPNANLSYTIQPESYPLMNAMEFANDQYISWDLTYWANGALFNRIPLLKKLKLREVVSFRGLYGSLTDKNNPLLNNNLYRFPFDAFVTPMRKEPYMEIGVGIDNIFTFLRLDYVWRLTYRDTPNVDKSGVRVMLHFTF